MLGHSELLIVLELEGAVIDVEPAHWSAYSEAAGALGLPRTDRAEFWRIVRTGKPLAAALKGAKPKQLIEFEARYQELVESDEAIAQCVPQPEMEIILPKLNRLAGVALVTVGKNRAAKQKFLDDHRLSTHFIRMTGLSARLDARIDQLKELKLENPRCVVAAATDVVCRCASRAGMLVVGMNAAGATAQRLTQAGAQMSFADLSALTNEVECGASNLIRLGLLPIRETAGASPFVVPNHERPRGFGASYRSRRR
jgi:phosphoglycolate phosphatase-like HAD superfamily hydrolase